MGKSGQRDGRSYSALLAMLTPPFNTLFILLSIARKQNLRLPSLQLLLQLSVDVRCTAHCYLYLDSVFRVVMNWRRKSQSVFVSPAVTLYTSSVAKL